MSPTQRELVYEHIIDKFGYDYTAYVLAMGTISDKGTIDEIGRALGFRWQEDRDGYIKEAKKIVNDEERLKEISGIHNPYSLDKIAEIKKEYEEDPDGTKDKYPDIFYYFDGLNGTVISQGQHPAGIICSPVTLPDNYGTIWRDGKRILLVNMEECHEVSLVKYDILGLKNIEIIKDTCKFANIHYPLSHEINWEDKAVWDDMITSPAGIFQFEGKYAFDLLCKFVPTCVNDLSLVNASLRPSGESYRDRLLAREPNHNPSEIIDQLLADNNGYLIFQEDTIKFLQNICGLSGSEADNVRRAIGRKQVDRLQAALPQILDGYCSKSDKPREIAEKEAQEFLQIIKDSSNYQFGFNHSTGYSMIGYMCAYYRYYYPTEFICAYLNNANNEDDIKMGTELAKIKGIQICNAEFGHSKAEYMPDAINKKIYKGVSSIKFVSESDANALYDLRDNLYIDFVDFLKDNPANSRTTEILIQLDYFKEFGHSMKLWQTYQSFNRLYGKKQLKKEAVADLPQKLLQKFCEKETDKMYKFSDTTDLISAIAETYQNKELPLKIRLAAQKDYLGYLVYKNAKLKGCLYVTDVNTKYSPVITGYDLATGETKQFKIYLKNFREQPVAEKDVLVIQKTQDKPRMKLVGQDENGKNIFEPIPNEYWTVITEYVIK